MGVVELGWDWERSEMGVELRWDAEGFMTRMEEPGWDGEGSRMGVGKPCDGEARRGPDRREASGHRVGAQRL